MSDMETKPSVYVRPLEHVGSIGAHGGCGAIAVVALLPADREAADAEAVLVDGHDRAGRQLAADDSQVLH